jgi:hypothetical protein
MVDLIENMIITDEKNAYSARSLGEECSGQASGRAACAVIGVPYPVRRESIVYGYAVRLRTHPARPASRAVGALSVMQAVAVAGQLMVVLENPSCLVNLPSAQVTGIVSGQELTRHATGDQSPSDDRPLLTELGSPWLTLVVTQENSGIIQRG